MCKWFLVLFSFCAINSFGTAYQFNDNKNINLLLNQLENSKTDGDKLDALLDLSKYYLNTQPDSSFQFAKRAQILAKENNSLLALAKSENLLGENFMVQGVYSRAIELLLQANENFELVNDQKGLATNYVALGNAYQYSKQHTIAKEYYEAALDIFKKTSNKNGLASAYGNIGHVYEKEGKYDEALVYQERALKLYLLLKMPEGIAAIYDNLGSIYEDLANYDSAYYYFNASADLYRLVSNSAKLTVSLNNIGDVFRKKGDYETALIYTKKSLVLAKQLHQKYQIRSAYRDFSKLYAAKDDFEKAYLYMDSTYSYSGEIFNDQIAEQIASLQTLYETQRKEQEIALLESENKAELLLRYLFIAGIILISTVAYIIIKHQRLSIKKNKEVLETQERIHRAKQELTQAELHNTQLKEKSLEIDLENRKLKEEQLNKELAIKDKEMTSRALHIIQKNKLLKELRENIQDIKKSGNGSIKKIELNKLDKLINYSYSFDKDWEDFQRSFEHVHAEFFKKLQIEHPNLTASELRLCALMRLNLNSKDIATILGISQDSLRIARYRLRKKFDLPKGSNLPNYIMQF